MDKLFIGTSGWSYDDWVGDFYPEGTEKIDMLNYYIGEFNSVEINATFYRLPFENMIKGWNNKASNGFQYAVKAPRQVTHYDKLDADDEYLSDFFSRIKALGDHLGPVLWQLPPSLEKDVDLLKDFFEKIDTSELKHALEFRDESWLEDEVFAELESRGVASVSVSSNSMPVDFTDTGDFVYYRFHGLSDNHRYNYSKKELDEWAERCAEALNAGKEAYVFFNNTASGDAPMNANVFRDMVERKAEG